MKASALFACFAIVAALALLAGCQPDSLAETDSCMECHSGDTSLGNAVLAAQAQYENSGHYLGPRTYTEAGTSEHIFMFHGSNAAYCNGWTTSNIPANYCSQCHTHQGFVEFVATGTPVVVPAASQPGCFTCHEPHISGNFSLRKLASETLADGNTFNYGQGNLCATCHKARTNPADFLVGANVSWRSSSGPHHGPQADLLVGAGHWGFGGTYGSYQTDVANPHTDGTDLPNSCVNCHMYETTDLIGRFGGTLELGGHGMYLTGDVHGTETDIVASCKACHPTGGAGWTSSGAKFINNGHVAATDWDGDSVLEDKLLEIRGLRNTLIAYFGDGTNQFSGPGTGPIEGLDGTSDVASGEWNKDWQFQATTTSYSIAVSRSFWNFKLFIEDKSGGIHNPTFAAQILWDAVKNLNDNGETLVLGTRP